MCEIPLNVFQILLILLSWQFYGLSTTIIVIISYHHPILQMRKERCRDVNLLAKLINKQSGRTETCTHMAGSRVSSSQTLSYHRTVWMETVGIRYCLPSLGHPETAQEVLKHTVTDEWKHSSPSRDRSWVEQLPICLSASWHSHILVHCVSNVWFSLKSQNHPVSWTKILSFSTWRNQKTHRESASLLNVTHS